MEKLTVIATTKLLEQKITFQSTLICDNHDCYSYYYFVPLTNFESKPLKFKNCITEFTEVEDNYKAGKDYG